MGSALPKDANGWTIFTPSGATRHRGFNASVPAGETMQIYVSNTAPNNSDTTGDGSPSAPYRTILKGASMLRSGSPDWLQLRVGDYFINQSICTATNGSTYWTKNGKSPTEPMVIGQWHPNRLDEPNVGYTYGARPIVDPTGTPGVTCFEAAPSDNIWVTGIEFYPSYGDPNSPNYNINLVGGNYFGVTSGHDTNKTSFGLEDIKITFCSVDVIYCAHQDNVSAPGIAIYRNVVRTCWGIGGHVWGGGGFQDWRENMIDATGYMVGVAGSWSPLLHNTYFSGQPIDDPQGAASPGVPGWLNEFTGNILAREDMSPDPSEIQRSSQFRAGGRIINNLMLNESINHGCFRAYNTQAAGIDKNYIAYNVWLLRAAACIQLGDAYYFDGQILIEHNIASTTNSNAEYYNPFLQAEGPNPYPGAAVTVRNNIIWRWVDRGPLGGSNSWNVTDWQANNRYYNTLSSRAQPINNFGFPHPNYTMADFMNAQGWTGEDYVQFLDRAALQQKGRWDQRLTSAYVNDWFRVTAFNEPAFSPATILNLLPATLPNGSVGVAYNQTFGAVGGTGPYTFQRTSGTLPTGLTLTSAGLLSGTPTTANAFTFSVQVTDSVSATSSISYTVTIVAPVQQYHRVNLTVTAA